jgi:type III pantothenate kinase
MLAGSSARAQRLVTIDCGNSTIDCRRADSGARSRVAYGAGAAGEVRGFLLSELPESIVVVSVVRSALDVVRSVAAELGVPAAVAGIDIPCPLRIAYATPATLGADRWVGCLAAHRASGRAIVVDCGSATTINVVEEDGAFRGGAIGPGLRAILAGMAQATPALPPARLDAERVDAVATSTQAAIDAGVLLGYCGAVERLVAGALATMRGGATVYLTGGNAEIVSRHGRLAAELVPDLVHRGLEILAERAPWKS